MYVSVYTAQGEDVSLTLALCVPGDTSCIQPMDGTKRAYQTLVWLLTKGFSQILLLESQGITVVTRNGWLLGQQQVESALVPSCYLSMLSSSGKPMGSDPPSEHVQA